jgi:hypothetical protein
LDIGCCVAIDLVAGQDDKVWLFIVENSLDKLYGPRVGIAVSAVVAFGLRVSAVAQASAEMQVGYLHDLEFAILPDLGYRLLHLGCRASSYAETRIGARFARLEMQGSVLDQFPARTWLYCISAKKNVDGRYCLLGVARVTLQ